MRVVETNGLILSIDTANSLVQLRLRLLSRLKQTSHFPDCISVSKGASVFPSLTTIFHGWNPSGLLQSILTFRFSEAPTTGCQIDHSPDTDSCGCRTLRRRASPLRLGITNERPTNKPTPNQLLPQRLSIGSGLQLHSGRLRDLQGTDIRSDVNSAQRNNTDPVLSSSVFRFTFMNPVHLNSVAPIRSQLPLRRGSISAPVF
jgi:hypothetical protein